MSDPAPIAVMTAFSDSSVSIVLRLWCRSGDYLTTMYSLQENGKKALETAGIVIPFPQMDVHLKHDKEALLAPSCSVMTPLIIPFWRPCL